MRTADYIAERLSHLGVKNVYMVTGGAAMHLNDAFGRVFSGRVHCLHHEQSCAMAAEGNARITGLPSVVNVTAGPGSINAINGVFGAFVDSIPMIVVSGQAKRETLKTKTSLPNLRQLGDQEVDIAAMVSGVCKQSHLVDDPTSIPDLLDDAFIAAISGRPGPVWLDIPVDVQAASLPEAIRHRVDADLPSANKSTDDTKPIASDDEIQFLAKRLLAARRPVLYVGSGIRQSGSYHEFLNFLAEWKIPTVTGWNSNDLLWDDHPCYSGRPGTVGNRAGNFAVQYADCLLTVGCRLNIRQVSFNWKSFAKNAWKAHVDIDKSELDKPTLTTDLKIHAHIKDFFPRLAEQLAVLLEGNDFRSDRSNYWERWRAWTRNQVSIYSPVKSAIPNRNQGINPYRFIDQLTSQLPIGSTTVCADGTACVVGFQAAVIKPEQRLFHNSGCASMGYELPASIGAYHATGNPVTCIAGDGSIMMNLQELSVIGGQKLPISIHLLNNRGYHSIRQTQKNYFPDNPVGCGIESGLPFPDFDGLAKGFGLTYIRSSSEDELRLNLANLSEHRGPYLHEVILDLDQDFSPKLSSRKLDDGSMITSELEDMAPFLDRAEMDRIRTEAMAI